MFGFGCPPRPLPHTFCKLAEGEDGWRRGEDEEEEVEEEEERRGRSKVLPIEILGGGGDGRGLEGRGVVGGLQAAPLGSPVTANDAALEERGGWGLAKKV